MDLRVLRTVLGHPGCDDSRWTRRRWIGNTALAVSGLATTAWGQAGSKSKAGPGESEMIEPVQARARKAALGEFGISRSAHFLCAGDASKAYREEALGICESLAKDFRAYFRGRGFKVDYPDHRMSVVALKDVGSFGKFIGKDPGENVGGQYELDTNQLVIFDLRSLDAELNVEKKRLNTFALVHETIHMLCFNTGMLSRDADVPVCISEGLATYGELWLRARGTKAFGAPNGPRLVALPDGRDPKIPIAQLLKDDDLFFQSETEQLAYAESWLLVSSLLKGPPAQAQKFQAYLAGLPKLGDRKDRIQYAEARLGPLRDLEQEVRRFRIRLPGR
ncbi:MAG: DUF1570 domain-containing protein [Isosphaeraceae bacterium]